MVTLLDAWTNGQKQFVGLSTDEKPTIDIRNGDLFIEMDTGTWYLYGADDACWRSLIDGSSSGGGGSTDNKVGTAVVGTAKVG